MNPREQTPHRPVELLSVGEYRTAGSYKTWRPKGTDDWLLLLTVAGEGVAASGSHQIETRGRGAVLFRPGAPQEYRLNDAIKNPRWHFLWAHFRPSAGHLPWLAWPEVAAGFYHIASLPEKTHRAATTALRDAKAHLEKALPDEEALAMNALERAILNIGAYCRGNLGAVDFRIQRVVRFISRNLHCPLSLKDLAMEAGMSVSHFCHLFPRHIGKSPLAFLEESRMRHAAMRLRLEDAPIAEIAYGLGYGNPFYFTNRFRKHYGMSPTAYREKMRPSPSGKRR